MNKKQNPLAVRVGDTVEIRLLDSGTRPFTAVVTKVADLTMVGQRALINYTPDATGRDAQKEKLGIPYACSIRYVQRIIARAPYVMSQKGKNNIFRPQWEQRQVEGTYWNWCGFYQYGGYIVSEPSLDTLVLRALACVQEDLDRPVNLIRFHTLWKRDGYRGKVELSRIPNQDIDHVSDLEGLIAVRWAVFRAYVIANRQKIMMSRKEMEAEGRAYQEDMLEDYFEQDLKNSHVHAGHSGHASHVHHDVMHH
jgi:hypothetical protein